MDELNFFTSEGLAANGGDCLTGQALVVD